MTSEHAVFVGASESRVFVSRIASHQKAISLMGIESAWIAGEADSESGPILGFVDILRNLAEEPVGLRFTFRGFIAHLFESVPSWRCRQINSLRYEYTILWSRYPEYTEELSTDQEFHGIAVYRDSGQKIAGLSIPARIFPELDPELLDSCVTLAGLPS